MASIAAISGTRRRASRRGSSLRGRGPALGLVLLVTGCGASPEASPPPPPAAVAARLGPAGVPAGTLELRRWGAPAERVVIDRGGVAIGPAGEPAARYLFAAPERLGDLGLFLRTYAPFRLAAPEGDLAFGGQGTTVAGSAEERAILEWARLVAAEATTGERSGAAYGLALSWHAGGAVGSCDDVAVYLTGEVRASSCGWPGEMRGRLAPEALARLYAWFDGLRPFQAGGEEEGGAMSEQASRVVFAGRGNGEPAKGEIAAMLAFGPALHRELAARRPGAAASGGAGEEGEAGPRLLLPPERAGGLMQPPARLPEYVPPPPRDWETAEPGEAVPRPLKPRPRPKPSPESGAATTPPT